MSNDKPVDPASWLLGPDEKRKRDERERQERIRNNAKTISEYRIPARTYDPFRKKLQDGSPTNTGTKSRRWDQHRKPPLPDTGGKPTRDMPPVILKVRKPQVTKIGEFADILEFDPSKRRKR